MKLRDWFDETKWSDIPKDLEDYTPEQYRAMKHGLKYWAIIAVALLVVALVGLVPPAICVVISVFCSFALFSRPAIKSYMEDTNEN